MSLCATSERSEVLGFCYWQPEFVVFSRIDESHRILSRICTHERTSNWPALPHVFTTWCTFSSTYIPLDHHYHSSHLASWKSLSSWPFRLEFDSRNKTRENIEQAWQDFSVSLGVFWILLFVFFKETSVWYHWVAGAKETFSNLKSYLRFRSCNFGFAAWCEVPSVDAFALCCTGSFAREEDFGIQRAFCERWMLHENLMHATQTNYWRPDTHAHKKRHRRLWCVPTWGQIMEPCTGRSNERDTTHGLQTASIN